MDRSWLLHWKKAFVFLVVQGLLIATGVTDTIEHAQWLFDDNHPRHAVPAHHVSASLCAGLVVGHESQQAAATARSYPDCRRAPYSCKVQMAVLRHAHACARWVTAQDANLLLASHRHEIKHAIDTTGTTSTSACFTHEGCADRRCPAASQRYMPPLFQR